MAQLVCLISYKQNYALSPEKNENCQVELHLFTLYKAGYLI